MPIRTKYFGKRSEQCDGDKEKKREEKRGLIKKKILK
jgi:hypothetical protein